MQWWLINIDSYDVLILAQEVDKICNFFSIREKYLTFSLPTKRIYENGTSITLANHPEFFKEFLRMDLLQPKLRVDTRQPSFCFWDEILSEAQLHS